ncbi:hypothetical protein CC78DRAFT_532414 [Lojkania enalia]|uniref:Uncharacterized protein n=1 Tax=Lojkania enalia TaxID=147567 RepID=A0A9P4N110_9PLEO|nr:hypothetical protein CC78DRAFT_532414 [Didymosphaeria enalia]
MTKKRKRYPNLQQKLDRPWCYYCERDFDDLKILISHQKAKHFKCDRCGRRLNTAGGLSVHMSQVHKENLTHVENSIPGRQGLENEIFGMEGVPQDAMDQHNQQVTQKHFAEEQERARVSGNAPRGLFPNGSAPQSKRPRVRESIEEIEKRAEQWRRNKAAGIPTVRPDGPVSAPGPQAEPSGMQASPPLAPPFGAPPVQPPAAAPAFSPPGQGFPPPGAPGFPPGQQFYGGPPPPGAANAPSGPYPFASGTTPAGLGLPQRPPFGAPLPGQFPLSQAPGQNGHRPPAANEISDSLDELISNARGAASAATIAEAAPKEKSKKEKNIKLVFEHEELSPEELMAQFPRYTVAH